MYCFHDGVVFCVGVVDCGTDVGVCFVLVDVVVGDCGFDCDGGCGGWVCVWCCGCQVG